MQKEITCINCPMGCRMTVTLQNAIVTRVTGNTCKRGEAYAKSECTAPVRIVTSLVMSSDGKPISVKTDIPIPKEKIFACLSEIAKAYINLPVSIGEIIIKNVCGTGANVVATKSRI